MNRLCVLWLAMLVAATPSTTAAPVDSLTAVSPVEIRAAGFLDLRGVAVDADGAVYVADRAAGTVTRIAADLSRTIVAAGLVAPVGLAFDPAGRLLIAEEDAGRIVHVDRAGQVVPVASDLVAPRWLVVSDTGPST